MQKSAFVMAGNLLGLDLFSKASAFEKKDNNQIQPSIALIIDDIGYSVSRARQFLELEIPLTYSVLPKLPNSYYLSCEINKNGHEIMLHQPMEPYNPDLDPGPGALYIGDEEDRIIRVMEENISEIPYAKGINNHMGSKFTACQIKIFQALRFAKDSKLFFVDSLTSSNSKGYMTARSLKMAAAHRNIFIDNRVEESAILYQLLKLKRHAINHGTAVGIGHPFPETASAIKTFYNKFLDSGASLVHISEVIKA
ncbi:MAG: divergent polysaccharide deacetylase family protein [Pseudomonadota bacterium]|nr:divergent polysaccharide deacetylase family protein [Pseudomonadota bacterium]MBU1569388.1 divergent polysaccharide deacetylase family protein [Pseudomonadota bacterium]